MKYLSVCSGIEAATVAWHPLGWSPVAFAEIEKFPSAVLAHHYPSIPNLGDITKFKDWPDAALDVLVGGTPCQSFSVAGLRQGLADPRGNLCLTYLAIADRYRPEWILWENVPGVLSSDGGRDFGAFLGGLGQLGYGWSYRVLDAQYVRIHGFGRAVPQRRRRVFVVGNLRDWRRAAAVLFERESLQGNTPPRREAGKGFATDVAPSIVRSGRGVERTGDTRGQDPVIALAFGGNNCSGPVEIAAALAAHSGPAGRMDFASETFVTVAPTLDANYGRLQGHDNQHIDSGAGLFVAGPAPIAFDSKASGRNGFGVGSISPTLRSMGHANSHQNAGGQVAVAFDMRGREGGSQFEGPHHTANIRAASGGSSKSYVAQSWAVRRLTPLECERLQGFSEIQNHITVRVCWDFSDQQKSNALAEILSRKLPPFASNADENGYLRHVLSAEPISPTDPQSLDSPVALHVLIDLEREAVRIRNAERLFSFAKGADDRSAFPLPTGLGSFAQLAALLMPTLAPAIAAGRAASLPNTRHSLPASNGSAFVIVSGREIGGHASDAESSINIAKKLSMSTTSGHGHNSENLASILETLSCCVVHAIASFIPEKTTRGSSFDVRLTISQGYTNIPWRGKNGAPDGPRYKALGNSMAVNAMRWLGTRIQMVSEIAAAQKPEAAE